MLPDLNEYMVKEHIRWLEKQARQIAIHKKYGFKKTPFMKWTVSYLTKFMALIF